MSHAAYVTRPAANRQLEAQRTTERQPLMEFVEDCRRQHKAEYAWLCKVTGKSIEQIDRDLTRRDKAGGV